MFAAELRGDAVHFALRLRQRDTRLQLAENGESGQIPRERVVGNLRWPPQFGIAQQQRLRRKQQVKIARQYSDNRDVLPVVPKILPDNRWISTESPLPESVTENDHVRSVDQRFFRQKIPPQGRSHTERRKQIWGDESNRHLLRALVAFHGAKINSRAAPSSRGSDLLEQ